MIKKVAEKKQKFFPLNCFQPCHLLRCSVSFKPACENSWNTLIKSLQWNGRFFNSLCYLFNWLLLRHKSSSHLSKKVGFICFDESPLKMMSIAFYLSLYALFVFKIFTFSSRPFWLCRKTVDKKAKVNFNNFGVTNWNMGN